MQFEDIHSDARAVRYTAEFFEELKRLNINIILPDINKCFAEFTSNGKDFLYALGAIKNVGYEAISQLIEEREKNGKFKSISDFITVSYTHLTLPTILLV